MTRRLLLTAALLLLLIPTLIFAQAQNETPVTVRFIGTVQTRISTALVMNGIVVDLRRAEISGDLLPGTVVLVYADIEPDGKVIAREVSEMPVGIIPGLVEIQGIVREVDDNTLRIGSQTIGIIVAQKSGIIAVGQPVLVIALQHPSGDWLALAVLGDTAVPAPAVTPELIPPPVSTPEVAPVDPEPPVSTPEALPPGDDSAIQPPAATPEIIDDDDEDQGDDDASPPIATPEVVAPVSTPEVSDDFRVEGRLEAVGSSAVIVDGQTYDISNARIDDPLSVGAFVRMEVVSVGGRLVVERIRVEDD